MSLQDKLRVFATITPGLEAVGRQELQDLGISRPKKKEGGFSFQVSFSKLCELNLHARILSGFLVRIGLGHVSHLNDLVGFSRNLKWNLFLDGRCPILIKVTSKRSKLYHTGAIAERIQKGIQHCLGRDLMWVTGGNVPINTQRVIVRIVQNEVTCSLNGSGEHLHRRGYRKATAKAPIRENIAAGCLKMMGYDGTQPLLDPMTGAGTFGIEGAMIAKRQAPGLFRRFAFMNWPMFDSSNWQKLCETAKNQSREVVPPIFSSDRNSGAIAAAKANASLAGVVENIQFRTCAFFGAFMGFPKSGFCIINPPYGDRIGDSTLRKLYASFSEVSQKVEKMGVAHRLLF